MWYRTRGSCSRGLAILFGQTSTPMYRWLKFGRMILFKYLINNDDTKLKLPSQEEIQVFKNTISDKYPVLDNVYGAVDGLKLKVQESGNFYIQDHLCNGCCRNRLCSSWVGKLSALMMLVFW